MSAQPTPFNLQTARRFLSAVRDLLSSEVRQKVIGLLILLAMFALSVNGLNVVNSYIGRDLMTASVAHDMEGFIRLMTVYLAVFAAMTAAAVLYRFSEERWACYGVRG